MNREKCSNCFGTGEVCAIGEPAYPSNWCVCPVCRGSGETPKWLPQQEVENTPVEQPAPQATVEQPMPQGTGPSIHELVQQDIEARARLGEEKYGERLRACNGRDALVDAYQEVLDLAVYLRQQLTEDRILNAPPPGAEQLTIKPAEYPGPPGHSERILGNE